MFCPHCGAQLPDGTAFCTSCGQPTAQQPSPDQQAFQQQPYQQQPYQQQPYQPVYPQPKQSNGMGITGFVLALLALLLCWVPVLNWILWILGLIFSIIGMFKKPKGLAIAGLIISLIGLIVDIVLIIYVSNAASSLY